jgi:hypothetical protein
MTNLNRPVRRRTRDAYPVLHPKPERIIVTLFPGDTLIFRCERRRQEWHLPIAAAFHAAVLRQVKLTAKEKKGGRHV